MSSTTSQKANRLSIRVSDYQKDLLNRAARAKDMNVTQFVLEVTEGAAREILSDQTSFHLSQSNWELFCNALERPAQVIPELKTLFEQRDLFHG